MRSLPILLLLLVLPACTPTINIDVMPGQERLKPQAVLADPNAGSRRVAMIDVRGLIVDSRLPGLVMDGPNPVDRFATQLALARDDPSVKAVIVRINSPGGTVTGSDIMHQELVRFRRESGKPAVASIGEVGASGGYYLALAADRILAEPTSITGSIGVIMPTVNISGGLARIGVQSRAIKSGENKDLANPLEPIREGQYEVLQAMVDDMYTRFKALVVERRPGIPADRLAEVTDGRVLTGGRAHEAGLVDEVGGVHAAFARAKELAGIPGATLIKYTDPALPPRSAYSKADTAGAGTQINLVQVQLPGGLPAALDHAPIYYLWSPQ